MKIDGWKYYNHAAIPTTAPHEEVNMIPIDNGNIWKMGGIPLLARWTTDFDCGYETNWWYVIKDTPFDINAIKSNYRYKINKGSKYFNIRVIDPLKYINDLYEVFVAAYESWPSKYRPLFSRDDAHELALKLSADSSMVCYGAFHRETEELCGFMQVPTYENYVELQVQRVKPEYEKLQINAALVYGLIEDNNEKLEQGGFYILDGARSINHETAFQDYLEKYFGFRKAYCNLHITYNPKIELVMKLLFPMRRILYKLDGIGAIHQINGVLKMEQIYRKQKMIEQ